MKKSVIRVFSMLLTLAMLFGMCASAQTQKITFDLNGYDGTKLDGVLSIGFDEDGCEQYAFENSMLGKFVLQSDGNDLVFGADQIGFYAISSDDLSEAITTVISMLAAQEMDDDALDIMNYFNSPAFERDAIAAGELLGNEINRLASIANSLGLVVIYENGDLAINANVDMVFALITAYLEALANDANALNAFIGLEIFNVAGVSMTKDAGELSALLKEAAAGVNASLAQAKSEVDGGLELYVSAETGAMTGKYYTSTMYNGEVVYSMTESFTVSADGSMKVDAVINEDGCEVKYNCETTGNNVYYSMTANAEGQSAALSYKLDENGFVAELVADTVELAGEGKIVIDANGIDGKWDYTGKGLVFNGSINYDPAKEEFLLKVNYSDSTSGLKANVEYASDELYAEMTRTERGQVVADFTVSGSETYRIKGTWTDGYDDYSINMTLRSGNKGNKVEGTLTADGEVYDFLYTVEERNHKKTLEVVFSEGTCKSTSVFTWMKIGSAKCFTYKAELNDPNQGKTNRYFGIEIDPVTDRIAGEWDFGNGAQTGAENTTGSFYFGRDMAQVIFSDDEANYRIYVEGDATEVGSTLKAGLSGAELSDPEVYVDLIKFILNVNNDMTFDANLDSLIGIFGAAGFDGQSLKIDVTTGNGTFTFEGKPVVTDNAQYLEFTGFVSGAAFEARIGMRTEENAVMCLFCEALLNGEKAIDLEAHLIRSGNEASIEIMGDSVVIDGVKAVIKVGMIAESNETVRFYAKAIGDQPGYEIAAYLPVTVVETADKTAVSAALTLEQGGAATEIGNASFAYETVYENMDHVEGERLTSDMLVEMIMSMLGVQ